MTDWTRRTRAALLALCFGGAASGLLFSGAAHAATRAIVIGNDDGLATDPPLQFAEADAAATAGALVDVGAVPRADVLLLRGASRADIAKALDEMNRRSGADDVLLIFFSGHGDGRGAHVAGNLWDWSRVRGDLAALKGRLVVAFFDTCSSGALITAKGTIARGPPIDVAARALGPAGRFLITSSGANELSYESARLRASPFALALRTGLRGAADFDGDGRITLPELYSYVYERTLSATVSAPTGPQHPMERLELAGTGAAVIVDRRGGVEIARVSAALGPCYVLDRNEVHVLGELEARAGAKLELPAGDYVVKCLPGDRLRVANLRVGSRPTRIDDADFRDGPPEYALAKGPDAVVHHHLEVAAGALAILRGDTATASAIAYRAERGTLSIEPRLVLTWPRADRAVFLTLGLGSRLPWWKAGGTALRVGVEVGARIDLRGADRSGNDASGVAPLVGSYVGLDRRITERLALCARASFWTLYPTSSSAAPQGAVSFSLGLVMAWPNQVTE